MARRLPAEWEPCCGVLLAWPHAESDWAPQLTAARDCVAAIAAAVSQTARVLLLCQESAGVAAALAAAGCVMSQVQLVEQPVGDTWCRDYGPLTVYEDGQPLLVDWGFNGWGLKYAAAADNLATRRLHAAGYFGTTALETMGLILEGGAVESDGAGTLLSTWSCLREANRNPHLTDAELSAALLEALGGERLLCLSHGRLAGDDTDGHIDTLARLCPNDCIAYVSCDDPSDEHYAPLQAMAAELQELRSPAGKPYRLQPLPWPRPCVAADGHRLPATYANFLVCNELVLVPTYADPQDQAALEAVGRCFPSHRVQGIDCRVLVQQHGSLHCMTMQLPAGVLPPPQGDQS